MDIIYIVIAIAGIAVGFAVDRVLLKRSVDKKLKEAEAHNQRGDDARDLHHA